MDSDISKGILSRTALYECHRKYNARFVEFYGWEMPVQYSGLIDEHLAVRQQAGLFDVSHMGEFVVRGPKALPFLQHVTSNNVAKLVPGRAQYSALLNHTAGVVDDIIVYCLAEEDYLLCVNAANTAKDFQWLVENNEQHAELENVSAEYTQIAIQGPFAEQILVEALGFDKGTYSLQTFRPFAVERRVIDQSELRGLPLILARTGYTGEDGFELFVPWDDGPRVWEVLMVVGQQYGVKPVGLGARDTLRLEVCYPLHGYELRDDVNVLQSGLGWVVKMKKGDFIGRDAVLKVKENGLRQKLVGLEVQDRGIIRAETKLYSSAGQQIGVVTSGTKLPFVNKAAGLAFVDGAFVELGTVLEAEVRGRRLKVKVIETPFYKRD